MSKGTYYWIGEGVIPYKGKDIAYGEALPEDFPKESITSMLAKKKLSAQPPATQSGAAGVNAEVKRLQELLVTTQGELDNARNELRQAQEQIDTLNATVEGLTAQLTSGPAPVQAAGPKDKK